MNKPTTKPTSIILESLKKGITSTGCTYCLSDPLSLHLGDVLKDQEITYGNVSKAVSDFLSELNQFDSISLPDGTRFKKDFEPTIKPMNYVINFSNRTVLFMNTEKALCEKFIDNNYPDGKFISICQDRGK